MLPNTLLCYNGHRVIFHSIRDLTNLVKVLGAKAKHYNTKDFI